MGLKHDITEPRSALWGSEHSTGDENYHDMLRWNGSEWEAVARTWGEVIMTTGVTPPDPVLNSDGDDWVYSS